MTTHGSTDVGAGSFNESMSEQHEAGAAAAQTQVSAAASSEACVSVSEEPAGEPTSIAVPARDLKTGDGLLAEGRLEEALAAYNGFLALWRAKLESGSSLLAVGKVELARNRIGALAAKFLLRGEFQRALDCAEAALAVHPKSVIANLNRAHALMFLGFTQEARSVYARYWDKNLPARGRRCSVAIMESFFEFRRAGLEAPLMEEIGDRFLESQEAEQRPVQAIELAVGGGEEWPVTEEPAAAALPADIAAGDQLLAQGKRDAALASYWRGLAIYQAKRTEDRTDVQARKDSDLAIDRICALVFGLLVDNRAKQALTILDEALCHRPNWALLHLLRAHALMLTGCISGALNIHREYCRRRLGGGRGAWGKAVSTTLAALRRAGLDRPIMQHIEKEFGAKA